MNVFERARAAVAAFRGRDRPMNPNDWSDESNWGQGPHISQFKPSYPSGGGWNGLSYGPSSSDRPDRVTLGRYNAETVLGAIQMRIALDVAQVEFHHVHVDENDNMKDIIKGSIENALRTEANIDQNSFQYTLDVVLSMFNEPTGNVAEVAVECDRDPKTKGITDELPLTLRTAKITKWYPQKVEVDVLDETTGEHEKIVLDKREVCIHENPFYQVMNRKNSLFSRLGRKMALLDKIDDSLGNGKLNAVLQLPYLARTDLQKERAKDRIKELELQMKTNELGIGYVDGTEKLIQLNRPLGEGLQSQIEWMTELGMAQISITKEVLNGTADPKTMANYRERCVGVVCAAISAERRRKLLTKEQRDKGESIIYVQDPFRLTPVTDLADLMDKSIRGAIMSPNEWRSIIGYKPSNDESANMLVNRNMPMDQTPGGAQAGGDEEIAQEPQPQYPPEMKHSAMPMNRQQRRQMERSKVPRSGSG